MPRQATRTDENLQRATTEAWLATLTVTSTRAAYGADLAVFGRWCSAHDEVPLCADAATIVAFQAARSAAGDTDATQRRRWSSLASFYRFALDTGSIEANPIDGAVRPQRAPGNPSPTSALTAAAVERHMSVAASVGPRLEALVALLVFDGLKLSEALALDVDDVRGRPPKMTLAVGRGGTARQVLLTSVSARAVRRCVRNRSDEPLFVSSRPGGGSAPTRLTRFGADHLIRRLTGEDEERVTANELRKYYFMAKADAGADERDTLEQTGLADVRTIRRYLSTEV